LPYQSKRSVERHHAFVLSTVEHESLDEMSLANPANAAEIKQEVITDRLDLNQVENAED
jgi:hypothetical protein